MATILNPTRHLNVDNCVTGHVADGNESLHPDNFSDYPHLFFMEILDNTKIDTEVVSDNNPLLMYHTNHIK